MIQEFAVTLEDSVVADYSSVDPIVTDGPAIVDMVQPKNNCTVGKYCKIYMKCVINFFNKTSRIDLIFDLYLELSLKEGVRASRHMAPAMIIKGKAKIKN